MDHSCRGWRSDAKSGYRACGKILLPVSFLARSCSAKNELLMGRRSHIQLKKKAARLVPDDVRRQRTVCTPVQLCIVGVHRCTCQGRNARQTGKEGGTCAQAGTGADCCKDRTKICLSELAARRMAVQIAFAVANHGAFSVHNQDAVCRKGVQKLMMHGKGHMAEVSNQQLFRVCHRNLAFYAP